MGIPKIDHCAVIDTLTRGGARRSSAIQTVLCCWVMSAQFSAPALAQQAVDPMEVCFRMTDPGARFACYDQEMQRRHAVIAPQPGSAARAPASAAVPTPSPATPGVTPTTKRPIDDTVGLDGKQLSLKRKEEGIKPETVQPIVATVATLKARPGHLYYFELDNGQVWESTESDANLFLDPHETVTIKPGLLGAFFLKTPEGNSIRVHRVR
jgi:hypothetical protein